MTSNLSWIFKRFLAVILTSLLVTVGINFMLSKQVLVNMLRLNRSRIVRNAPLLSNTLNNASGLEAKLPTARPNKCTSCFPQSSYIFSNEDVCSTEHPRSSNVKLLMLIFTTHANTAQRYVLRKTWTSIAKNNTSEMRYVFLLGKHDDPNWNNKIVEEAKQHGDIIIKDFKDTYRNLTLKTMSGFQWAVGFCSNAQYIMKTDDDMWVNTPKLLQDLDSWEINKEVLGNCYLTGAPHRDKSSKWYASPLEYPGAQYPGFCAGTGYVTTMSVLQAIVGVSPHIPYFFLEDVYIAICIKKLGYRLRNVKDFNNQKVPFVPCMYQRIITSHWITSSELEAAWGANC